MHFGNHGPASWPSLSATPAWSSSPASPAREPRSPPTPSPACWPPSPRRGARPSPSTTAPSSPATTASTPWASRPSSAIPDPPGRRGRGERHRPPTAPAPPQDPVADLSEAAFTRIVQLYNNTPRKCLGYRTPAETLDDQVLHLECELTESRAGGAVRGRLRPPSYRRAPSSFPPSPARVIPAKAGIQRGAARGVSVPHRTPTPHRRRASKIRSP